MFTKTFYQMKQNYIKNEVILKCTGVVYNFFNCRFTENMVFPSFAGNQENIFCVLNKHSGVLSA